MNHRKTIFERYTLYRDGSVYLGELRLPQYVNANGYLSVKLEGKFYTVHRLVASSFLSNDGKPCVNHIDGNRHNNSVENLEWCTYKENTAHAIKRGTHFNLKEWRSRA